MRVKLGEKLFEGVANIGTNPTFGVSARSIEVHLLDFSGEIYGQSLRLYFFDRLRDEIRFRDGAELAAAIRRDVESARRILAGTRLIEYREYLGPAGDPVKGTDA